MTIYERIYEMKNNTVLEAETAKDTYFETEQKLASLIGELVMGAQVKSRVNVLGTGTVISYQGTTLDNLIIEIEFENVTKRFSLAHILANTFIKFTETSEISKIWDEAFELHTKITKEYNAFEFAARQLALENKKKAEAEKKAEEKYQKLKEKAIQDFDNLVNNSNNVLSDVNEFYYSLGWLIRHTNSVSAALPDYLNDAFIKHFGSEAPHRVVDSRKRGPAGYQSQWSWSFSISLKKYDTIPTFLTKHLNPAGKSVTDTSFVWDLVDNYGFQFGKKQDFEKIRRNVPSKYLESFNIGFNADASFNKA